MATNALVAVLLATACGGDDTETATAADDDGTSAASASASATGSESDSSGSASASASASAGSESEGSTSGSDEGATTNTTTEGESTGKGDSSGAGSETGLECAATDESCANGEKCCEMLQCCEGVPVPRGQEYCALECPDSDRNIKENFAAIDADATLAKVAALPVTSWSYTFEDPGVRHIGPMAQDFKATFDVGATDKAIAKVDADGVALAAIQALDRRTKELRAENDELRERLAKLERATKAR